MVATVTALRCGALEGEADAFVAGLPGRLHLPVWAFLVRHPAGLVLFDTAIDPAVPGDPAGLLGRGTAGLFTFHVGPDDGVVARLGRLDLGPDDVAVVVNSHLHFDHAGGNRGFPNARCLVQEAELADAAERAGRGGYLAPDAVGPAEAVAGEVDVFGDGMIRLVPTPGHTRGHQAMVVATAAGPVVLTGDACYLRRALDEDRLPRFGWDLDEQRRSWAWLRTLEAAGATLVFGHDETVPAPVISDAGRPPHPAAGP